MIILPPLHMSKLVKNSKVVPGGYISLSGWIEQPPAALKIVEVLSRNEVHDHIVLLDKAGRNRS